MKNKKKRNIKRCSLTGKIINNSDEIVLVEKAKEYVEKQGYRLLPLIAVRMVWFFLSLFLFLSVINVVSAMDLKHNFEFNNLDEISMSSVNNLPNYYISNCNGLCINATDFNDEKFYFFNPLFTIENYNNYTINTSVLMSFNNSFGSNIYEVVIHSKDYNVFNFNDDINIIHFQVEFMDFGGLNIRLFNNNSYDDDITWWSPEDYIDLEIILTNINETHYKVDFNVYGALFPIYTSLEMPLLNNSRLAFIGLNHNGLSYQRENITDLSSNYNYQYIKIYSEENDLTPETPETPALFKINFDDKINQFIIVIALILAIGLFIIGYVTFTSIIIIVIGFIFLFNNSNLILSLIIISVGVVIAFMGDNLK